VSLSSLKVEKDGGSRGILDIIFFGYNILRFSLKKELKLKHFCCPSDNTV
jgi:hypothetical protein